MYPSPHYPVPFHTLSLTRLTTAALLLPVVFLLFAGPLRAQQPVTNPEIAATESIPSAIPSTSSPTASQATLQPPLIVVGFAGGFIKRTSTVHGEVILATHLREKYGANIHSEIFENHHGDDAHREILRLIQAYDIKASAAGQSEQSARVILYGHSWGASEAVAVARQLQADGVPVLLVVQVDSVPKRTSADDGLIPANVAQAINFYQSEGLLHGRPVIHAADPAATKILGNIHLTYKDNDVPTPGYPWLARTFTKRHIEIENDPRVWNQVEALITATLPAPTPATTIIAATSPH